MTTLLKLNVNKSAHIHGGLTVDTESRFTFAPNSSHSEALLLDPKGHEGNNPALLSNMFSKFTASVLVGDGGDESNNVLEVSQDGTSYIRNGKGLGSNTVLKVNKYDANTNTSGTVELGLQRTDGLLETTLIADSPATFTGQADLTVSGQTHFSKNTDSSRSKPTLIADGWSAIRNINAENVHGHTLQADDGLGKNEHGAGYYAKMDKSGLAVRHSDSPDNHLFEVSRSDKWVTIHGDVLKVTSTSVSSDAQLALKRSNGTLVSSDVDANGNFTSTGSADLVVSGQARFDYASSGETDPALLVKGYLQASHTVANTTVATTSHVMQKARVGGKDADAGLLAQQIRIDDGSGNGVHDREFYIQAGQWGLLAYRGTSGKRLFHASRSHGVSTDEFVKMVEDTNGKPVLMVQDGSVNALDGVVEITPSVVSITQDVNMPQSDIHCKNILVDGTMTTKNQEQLNIGDNHILLNSHWNGSADAAGQPIPATVAQSGGIASICRQMAQDPLTFKVVKEGTDVHLDISSGTIPVGSYLNSDNHPIILVDAGAAHLDDPINGLYVVKNGQANTNTRLELVTADIGDMKRLQFAQTKFSSDTKLAVGAEVTVTQVEVSHLYFHEDEIDHAGNHAVQYGKGSNMRLFHYVNLTVGDVEHSWEKHTTIEDKELATHVTEFTAGGAKAKLPTTAPKGAAYRVINNSSGEITITGDSINGGEAPDTESSYVHNVAKYSSCTVVKGESQWFVMG